MKLGSIWALAAGLLALATAASAQPLTVKIGTGGLTGVYYPTGAAICRLVNAQTDQTGIRCTIDSTGGSIDNIAMIRGGVLEFGVTQSDWQYHALGGTAAFAIQGPFPELRAVFSVHAEPVTILVRGDSGIANITDIPGHRFNIGNPGSGTLATWEVIEQAFGWDRGGLALATRMKSSEVSGALCDGRIDGYFWLVGHPSALTRETLATCDARLVPATSPEIDRLVAGHPYYRKATIPGGLYSGYPDDIPSFGVGATVVTSAEVPDEVVYAVARAVLGNLDAFRKLYPAFADLKAEEMIADSLTAPLHPGAIRAYRELGLMD